MNRLKNFFYYKSIININSHIRINIFFYISVLFISITLLLTGCDKGLYSSDETKKPQKSQVIITMADCKPKDSDSNDDSSIPNAAITAGGDIIGNSIPEKIWNYCRAAGYSEEACAAILGNGEAESDFNSNATDGTGLGDSIGIWQFTDGEKYAYLAWSGGSLSLEKQLEWMFGKPDKVNGQWIDYSKNSGLGYGHYYQGHSGVPSNITWYHTVDEFKKANDIEKATFTWLACYERGHKDYSNYANNRLPNAKKWYEKFTGKSATASEAATEEGLCDDIESQNQSFLNGEDVFFSQFQEPWGSMSYWSGTCTGNGCGPTSCTVALDIICQKNFTPKDMIEKRDEAVRNGDLKEHYYGADEGIPDSFYNKYFGVNIKTTNFTDNTLKGWKNALSDGKSVIVFSRDSKSRWYFKDGSLQPRQHPSGHYSVCWKYDGKYWYIKDVALNKEEGNNIPYTDEKMEQFILGRDRTQTKWSLG